MKQRLALGIAIMIKPKLLILDEPTSGLDPTGIIHLRNTLQELVKKEDMAILFSSHQLGEVEKLADRIICINKGNIIETPRGFQQQFSYLIQLDNVEKGYRLFEEWLSEDKIKQVGRDTIRVELNSVEILNEMLNKLINADLTVMDITKDSMDIETIYQEVYGD